ncbi:PaaI family thioesterase [Acuticoccus sp. I52.16.1]|uniref:PaaI family thioesterase n=1 Tax=Acuticoccus sp. I52.16.1 TaxID=2928472 RepID=UPI001FD0BCB0|nr:PaaI family thioesterase [Acuticoccus sp. I52.16.1]UOM34063.1 PaaI family thioesterase [Acuticoccus sp. I52.16.1]
MAHSEIDGDAVRARIDTALAEQAPGFETFFLARLLGATFTYLPQGVPAGEVEACRVRFRVEPFMFNPQGTLHGGIVATAMDISMGHLLNKATGATGTATIEMKTQYMRPVGPGLATAEGRFLRRGRTMCFLESRLTDEEGRLCAHATSTWKLPG